MEKNMGKERKNLTEARVFAKATDAVPEDFMISIRSAPRMPGSPAPALFLNIKADGAGTYYETTDTEKTNFELKNEFTLSRKAVEEIYDIVKKERFFDLKPTYRDPDVMDGDYAEIEIRANGRTYRVKTINVKVDAFDNIVRKVNQLVPQYVTIYYNALSTDEYKKVDR